MYIILSGQLKVLLEFENGEPIRLGSMRAGTTIGEMAFTTSLPRTATVVATEETVLYELTLENFRKLNKDHPDLALKLLEGINAVITTRLTHMNRSVQILTAS